MLSNTQTYSNGLGLAVRPAPGYSQNKHPKVLLVEDDPVFVKMLSSALEKRGVSVMVASDGKEALEMMNGIDEPSLILLDLMLPFYSGYEVLSKIRKKAVWKDVPIIVMTANAKEKNANRVFDEGANDYLVKPIRFEELMVRLRCFTQSH